MYEIKTCVILKEIYKVADKWIDNTCSEEDQDVLAAENSAFSAYMGDIFEKIAAAYREERTEVDLLRILSAVKDLADAVKDGDNFSIMQEAAFYLHDNIPNACDALQDEAEREASAYLDRIGERPDWRWGMPSC